MKNILIVFLILGCNFVVFGKEYYKIDLRKAGWSTRFSGKGRNPYTGKVYRTKVDTEYWVNGRRKVVTQYVPCDRYGNIIDPNQPQQPEQPTPPVENNQPVTQTNQTQQETLVDYIVRKW